MKLFYARFRKMAEIDFSFICVHPSVCPQRTTWLSFDGLSWNFVFVYFFEKVLGKCKFYYNLTGITGTLHEDRCTVLITSCSVLLWMKNFSDKSCRKNWNPHLCSINFFPENHTVYEIMWKNIVERGRPQMTIWRTRFATGYPRLQTHTQNM